MRKKDLFYVYEAGWPVVVSVPDYQMEEMKTKGFFLQKYMEAKIKRVFPLTKRPTRIIADFGLEENLVMTAGRVLKPSCGSSVEKNIGVGKGKGLSRKQNERQLVLLPEE